MQTTRSTAAIFESLEQRQLLSAVVDVRLPGGGKQIDVATLKAGLAVKLEVWVQIRGQNEVNTDEKLQSMIGSFLSTNNGEVLVKGDLRATRAAPFIGAASSAGTVVDLDADGDLDVGSNAPSSPSGHFAARSASLETEGVEIAGGQEFLVGTLNFTPTAFLAGNGTTSLNFRPRASGLQGFWMEDTTVGFQVGLSAGTPVVIRRVVRLNATPSVTQIPHDSFSTRPLSPSADPLDLDAFPAGSASV